MHYLEYFIQIIDWSKYLLVGGGELNFPVNTTRSKQRSIEDINSISCHYNLDIFSGFETIELIQKLQHSPLHFAVTLEKNNTMMAD